VWFLLPACFHGQSHFLWDESTAVATPLFLLGLFWLLLCGFLLFVCFFFVLFCFSMGLLTGLCTGPLLALLAADQFDGLQDNSQFSFFCCS